MGDTSRRFKHNEVKLRPDKKTNDLHFWLPSKFAKYYYGKRQTTIAFGAKDTEENQTIAERIRLDLQEDLQQGNFDPEHTLKYKHPSKQASKGYVPKGQEKKWSLYELWRKYSKAKKSIVASSTYQNTYAEGTYYDRYFKNLSKQSFSKASDQSEIRDELAERVKGKYVLVKCYQLLSSLINWGIEEEVLPKNHPNRFGQFRKEQEATNKRNQLGTQQQPAKFNNIGENNTEKIAFTWQEAQEVIKAFHNRRNRCQGLDHLAYMVEFLFLTGLRHGEARGLNWGDVSKDWKKLTVSRSYSQVGRSYEHVLKSTKNGKTRHLPLNNRAQEILDILWNEKNVRPDEPIFQSSINKRFKHQNLVTAWIGRGSYKSILLPLVEEGKISQYLKPYATRKTFITRQLQNNVDPKTLAYWVGDNVETIMEYYSDINREIVPV